MQKLGPSEHFLLTEIILRALAQNRICTILDFLQEDVEKLSTLTKLSLPQVLDIRNGIISKYSAPLTNGTTILVNNVNKNPVSTGIASLDAVLGGGISTGCITEICGMTDSGKTQLCFQLAINCVKNSENTILYVDTKAGFSATRIQKILEALGCSYKEMAQIMFQIRITNVWSMDEILELFKKLKDKRLEIKNLKLIIINSLPCLMFQHLGDENKIGLTLLNMLVNYCRFLCKDRDIGIICVNLQTRWIEQDMFDFDDDDEQTVAKESHIEKRNRCLGKYWQLIPAYLILLEKMENINKENFTKVNLTLARCSGVKSDKKCVLKICELGVIE